METNILETLKEANRESIDTHEKENRLLQQEFWCLIFDRNENGDILLIAPVKINSHRYYIEINEQFLIKEDAEEMAQDIYDYILEYEDLENKEVQILNY